MTCPYGEALCDVATMDPPGLCVGCDRNAARAQVAALRQWVAERIERCPCDDDARCWECERAAQLLADTAEAARGWLPPDVARECREALEVAVAKLDYEACPLRQAAELVLARLRAREGR